MKQILSKPSRAVRHLALIAGVLTVTFVAVPRAAEAGEFRAPHEVLHDLHMQVRSHVLRVVDHGGRVHEGYRGDYRQRDPRHVYHPRYDRPSYRYPVVVGRVGAYRPHGYYNDRRSVSGYVAIPPIAIGFDGRSGRPSYHDDCDRRDAYGHDGYRDDDRRRHDDYDDYDDEADN